MPSPSGLCCPGCHYPIFGLRDMVCPECGRKLDVRDFAIDAEDSGDRQRKLRRDGRIGISIGFFFLLLLSAVFIFPAAFFIYHGTVPPLMCAFVAAVFGVWVWRVLAWIGGEAMPAKKRRR